MHIFIDGDIPRAADFNGNFANSIDTKTATPQSMSASLTSGGTIQGSNLLSTGSLTVQGGQIVAVRVFTASGNYIMAATDYCLVVNKAVPQNTIVTLPNSPSAGRIYTIVDGSGTANSFPITVQASQNMSAYVTYALNASFAAVSFVYSGTQWFVSSIVGTNDGTIVTSPTTSRVSNTVSGVGTMAAGASNVVSGTNSIALGAANTASGTQAIALGSNSTASSNSISLGLWANDRGRFGQLSFASGRLASTTGDSQYGLAVFRKTVAATTTARLTADGLTAGLTNTANLVNGIAYGFGRIVVVAYDATNVKAAIWYIDNLLVIRGVNAAATVLVGSPTVTMPQASAALSALSAGSLTVVVDTTNGGINISLNNASAFNLDVVATIPTAEVF
jgi:hypothetical protein